MERGTGPSGLVVKHRSVGLTGRCLARGNAKTRAKVSWSWLVGAIEGVSVCKLLSMQAACGMWAKCACCRVALLSMTVRCPWRALILG